MIFTDPPYGHNNNDGDLISKREQALGRGPPGDARPTPKPAELAGHFIKLHTLPGEVVLDPFMGAGSTGVAAVETGRRFVGIELEPRWFDLACRRIADAQRQADLFVREAVPAVATAPAVQLAFAL